MKHKVKQLFLCLCCVVGLFVSHTQAVRANQSISGGDVAAMVSDETQPQYYLVLWMNDGSKVLFSFDDYPKVTHTNGEVVMTTENGSFAYSDSAVWKFTVSQQANEDTSVGNITSSQSSWHKAGDVIRFTSAAPGSQVSLYALSGMLLDSYIIGSDGTLSISLSALEQGIYVIKTKETTFKIAKK